MPDTIVWTGQSGKQELIRDLHENHLMNAYAKCVREDINADKRPALAAEIDARGLTDQPYGMDSAQFVSRYVPAMRSIVELRDTLHEVGREQAQVAAGAAAVRFGPFQAHQRSVWSRDR